MKSSLPDIRKKNGATDTNINMNTIRAPSSLSSASPSAAREEFLRRERWRTVHRVCGSVIDHNGYLNMLQGVRKNFLHHLDYNPDDQLPLIMHPRLPHEDKAAANSQTSRFSRGLRFTTEGGRAMARVAHAQESFTPLCTLEEEEREYLVGTEVWERRVLSQMMVVNYVTFVLREELDELQYCECKQRFNTMYEEEKERYWIENESDVSRELVRYKTALRAKEEKQRRLEEADVLYPMSRFSRNRHVCHPPPKEPDARQILQRYVRLKHGLKADSSSSTQQQQQGGGEGEGKRGELPALASEVTPGLRIPPRNTLRNALGISAYVTLLEKDTETRSMIEQCELQEFVGILALFKEQMSLLKAWEYKRMHLQRLLYWKEQLNERRQKVQMTLEENAIKLQSRFTTESNVCVGCEEEARQAICVEESVHRDLLKKMYDKASFEAKMNSLFAEQDKARAALEEDEAFGRQLWMQHLELALRVSLSQECEDLMQSMIPHQIDLLRRLSEEQAKHATQIVTIQRAFRRWKEGRLGWHFTHRDVGRIIQTGRNAKKIHRGLESMRSFKASLLADCKALEDEILALHEVERTSMCEKEFMHRVIITSQEEWEATAMHRTRLQDIIENMLLPKKRACIQDETDQRRELDVREEFERVRLSCFFYKLFFIMKEKRMIHAQEEDERTLITMNEAEFFRNIFDTELDEREILRITALEWEQQKEQERQALATSFLEMKHEAQRMHREHMHQCMGRCKAGSIEIEATDPSTQDAFMEEYIAGLCELFVENSLQYHKDCADSLQQEHRFMLQNGSLHILTADEEVARQQLIEFERDEREAIENEMCRQTDGQLRRLQQQTKASNTIKNFYRSYRKGEVGRTGMRNFLQEAFKVKNEKLELAAIHQSQRQDIQRCRDSLQEEIRQDCLDKQRAIEFKKQVLVEKTEPWARSELEKMENMMFKLILRNDVSVLAPSEVDSLAVLWQSESYERVTITREWKNGFEQIFEPKKSTFLLDIQACKIQRFLRQCMTRKRRLAIIKESMEQLQFEEVKRRDAIELQEMDERLCDVIKPMEGCAQLQEYLVNSVPSLLDHLCFDILYTLGIEEDEWRNRMLLLWRMRHHTFETTVAPEEASERVKLQDSYFYAGVEQFDFATEESTLRGALWNERVYFLLRMLVKAERESRTIIATEADKQLINISEISARQMLYTNYCTEHSYTVSQQVITLLTTVIYNEEATERWGLFGLILPTKESSTYPKTTINDGNKTLYNTITQNQPPPQTCSLPSSTIQWTEIEEKSRDKMQSVHLQSHSTASPLKSFSATSDENRSEIGDKSREVSQPVPLQAESSGAPVKRLSATSDENWSEIGDKSRGVAQPVPLQAESSGAPVKRLSATSDENRSEIGDKSREVAQPVPLQAESSGAPVKRLSATSDENWSEIGD